MCRVFIGIEKFAPEEQSNGVPEFFGF